MTNLEDFEKLDAIKSKILKYIMFKKRTEHEVRLKFSTVEQDLLDEIIEELKLNGYINDSNYVERIVKEYIALNKLSIMQMRYKILQKGIDINIIEDYFSNHLDELLEYELDSAKKIYEKKITNMDKLEVMRFLKSKGYRDETLKQLEE